jgi:hypothetical protein
MIAVTISRYRLIKLSKVADQLMACVLYYKVAGFYVTHLES